jgi:DNA-binding HxlR family transcriptional regulator
MIRNQVVDPLFPTCPIRNVLSRIGDRWSLLVLLTLQRKDKPMRFRDLCKAIPDVSQKMLISTLRELEADDLVVRKIYSEIPPHVEYYLTERGLSLIPLLNQLVEWSLSNMKDILNSRKKYVKKAKA